MICKAYYRIGFNTDRVGLRVGSWLIAVAGWRVIVVRGYFK